MSVFVAEGSGIRHHEPTCEALKAEVAALHPEAEGDTLLAACAMTKVNNTGPLRARTERCTKGCWRDYVLDERAAIATGERKRGRDDAFHAASVVNDAAKRDVAVARKAAAKRGESLDELAAPALARQKVASS